jgi:hypothetical protein
VLVANAESTLMLTVSYTFYNYWACLNCSAVFTVWSYLRSDIEVISFRSLYHGTASVLDHVIRW